MTVPIESTLPAKLEQKKYVVAFLDFLGAKEKMKSPEESDNFLQQIKDIYYFIKKVKERAAKWEIADVEVRIFSDNIVMARQIDNIADSEAIFRGQFSSCYSVLTFSAIFLFEALRRGLLVRGAVTIGQFVINNTFIYGDALASAYDLENYSAIYPRVIIDRALIEFIKTQSEKEQFLVREICDIDFDRECFLKIFNGSFDFYPDKEKRQIIKEINANISTGLSKYISITKYRQKYMWLATKFNGWCEANNYSDYKINFDE